MNNKEFEDLFANFIGKKKEATKGLQSIRDAIDACDQLIKHCDKILKGKKTKKRK
jgi:hypothetical protein